MIKYLSLSIFLSNASALYPMQLTIQDLTLDQKIGQLFMVAAVAHGKTADNCIQKKSYRMDKNYIKELICTYHVGGIIFLRRSNAKKQIRRTEKFQSISAIPLLIGQDLEPGRVGAARFSDFIYFPSNQTLGTINNDEYTRFIGHAIGEICAELGVHINFAPVADVNSNPDNPVINDRSFSNDPDKVAHNAFNFALGLHDAGIIACAKHFPGHGDTTIDSHYGLPVIAHEKERLDTIELYPFKKLIAAEIPAIMIGHLVVPELETQKNLPATLSKAIITDFLQKELGFKGLIITDALDMHAITNHYTDGQAELQALLAGNDILLCPVDLPAAITAIKQAIVDRIITEKEIDAHVEKILHIKQFIFN